MKTLVYKKGYLLKVTSWENDGDNYKTNEIIVNSIELAEALVSLCKKVFVSRNNGYGGIGNSMEQSKKTDSIILDFMKEHQILYKNEIIEDKVIEDATLIDICMYYNNTLMGSSKYYYSRVFESLELFNIEEDVYLDKII